MTTKTSIEYHDHNKEGTDSLLKPAVNGLAESVEGTIVGTYIYWV